TRSSLRRRSRRARCCRRRLPRRRPSPRSRPPRPRLRRRWAPPPRRPRRRRRPPPRLRQSPRAPRAWRSSPTRRRSTASSPRSSRREPTAAWPRDGPSRRPCAPRAPRPGGPEMTGQEIAFLIVSIVGGIAAIRLVTSQNVIHAALYLVVTLTSVGAVYLLLAAEFLAWVQILIYVGAIVVLLLFSLMLTKAPIGRDTL